MLELRSQLAKYIVPGRFGSGDIMDVTLSEIRDRRIAQVAGWPDSFETVSSRLAGVLGCAVPEVFGVASVADTVTTLWVGAERLWYITDSVNLISQLEGQATAEEAVFLDLSHSRTILRIKGGLAQQVLAKGVAVDIHASEFPVQALAHTMVEHVGVLLHRVGPEAFEIYVPRSYAVTVWHWLTTSAREFGYEVERL